MKIIFPIELDAKYEMKFYISNKEEGWDMRSILTSPLPLLSVYFSTPFLRPDEDLIRFRATMPG